MAIHHSLLFDPPTRLPERFRTPPPLWRSQGLAWAQFHPEADAIGMSMHLQTEEKKKTVIESHGYDKWESMIEHLNDPDKILWTYSHILPNFLDEAVNQLQEVGSRS